MAFPVKFRTSLLFYTVTILLVVAVLYFVMQAGKHLEPEMVAGAGAFHQPAVAGRSGLPVWNPTATLLLQLITIIVTSMLCAALLRKWGQPPVIGEIVAGILLGPSLLGRLAPGAGNFIFPASSLGTLQLVSQIGLILFMFITGMETDLKLVGRKAPSALVISHTSIAIPFGLGVTLAYFIYKAFAPPHVPFYVFSLFIGIAMSITAFPVLAGIVKDKGWTATPVGNIAICCAAADDITAWCLLAVVLSTLAGEAGPSLYALFLTVVYVACMIGLVKPLLQRLLGDNRKTRMTDGVRLALALVMLLISATLSEVLGIHALFGAFMAGICMPRNESLRLLLTSRIEDLSRVLLLPLFFVYTGLRTHIGLLDGPALWGTCALICLVAVVGKLGSSAVAARCMGESLRDSLFIGALMNTRGLVELVVLNIGRDMGILTPTLFAMLVIMALVTTLMTSPLLTLIGKMKGGMPGTDIH